MSVPRSDARQVALVSAGHFFSDFYANFLPVLLPVVTVSLSLSLTAGGVLIMVFSFASSILQPLCGYFIDRSGYAWLILVTMPVSAAFICLAGIAPSYPLLLACVALSGLGSSLFHPLGSSLVSKVTAPEHKGLSMSVFIGGGNFGLALAPAGVIFFLLEFGPRNLPWLILPALALSVAFYRLGLHRVDLAPPTRVADIGAIAWYKSVNLLKLNIVMGLRSWAQTALPSFLPLWLAGEGHPPTLAGSLLTVYLISGAVGAFGSGWLGDRIGRKTCIAVCLAISLPALFIFITSREISLLAWIALAISGAALQGTVPSSVVWAQEIIPANAAMASGMMLGLSFGLGGVGAAITGAMADYIGLQTALLWSLLPLVLALVLTWFIPAGDKARPSTGRSIA